MLEISTGILARYAADAAREVEGVHEVRKRGVKVSGDDGAVTVEIRVVADWGTALPTMGRQVQMRVRDYLTRMADIERATVDVVVDEVA